jgi:hypothetical protein
MRFLSCSRLVALDHKTLVGIWLSPRLGLGVKMKTKTSPGWIGSVMGGGVGAPDSAVTRVVF